MASIELALQTVAARYAAGSDDIADGGDTATGEVYCLAHHLKDGQVLVTVIRYQDNYSRQDGEWRLDDRTVITDWQHTDAVAA
ncbi:hypothetical protein GCM10022403_071960 [Streptomyces coacervatus]|uniref:SnoaL-like domain-containing protein n=1 Tax=Streptomyces coacervatus TaxID=647381 RepID=A0ABP7IVU8_9ACTN|nr:nuclear transport factor 2 family protein [Streptomyces coacervatus]MDF2269681.1 nuclear transport factor 2 family protein [Streptomyces coacervatus]